MEISTERLSDSMEMYLVTIVRLRHGKDPVPLSQLADSLNVTSVSVNEMCRKLQDNGLLVYRPYKGAVLTAEGEKLANHTLRRHRLWEVFLVQKLDLGKKEADEIACELEHVTPDDVIDRLDAFLAFPTYNPRGLPIPRSDQEELARPAQPITSLNVGDSARIVRCEINGASHLFLTENGLEEGVTLHLVGIGSRSVLIRVDGHELALEPALADQILVVSIVEVQGGPEEDVRDADDAEQNPITRVTQIPLSDLQKGQSAVIVKVGGSGAVRRRMVDMGLVTGSVIQIIREAPFGDPVEYRVKGYSLSLRKSEAKMILVEVLEAL